MLIQTKIFTAVLNGKNYASILNDKIVSLEGFGEDCIELRNEFIILMQWIDTLEDYLDNNFDSNGNVTPPIFACLTEDQIMQLVAKVGVMVGNNKITESDWILARGYWNDMGVWRDSAYWNDTLPII